MRTAISLSLIFAGIASAFGADSLPTWPHGAPGETTAIGHEHDNSTPKDALIAEKTVIKLTDVSNLLLLPLA